MSNTATSSFDPKSYTFKTASGLITGYQNNSSNKTSGLIYAKGIPYATASRFQPPQPHPPFGTPYNANKPSPICPQHRDKLAEKIIGCDPFSELEVSEEKCLRLSITLPSAASAMATSTEPLSSTSPSAPTTNAVNPRLPVFIWIYGGAYVFGAGDAPIYDTSSFVHDHNIITINITYRVGLFGYIGDGKTKPGNLGLLDQLAAVQWVHRNIEAFGGDAQNVTIAGQSAGADAVVHLLACREAKGLFRRAIIQSAPLGIRPGRREMLDALVKRSKKLADSSPPSSSSVDELVKGAEDLMSYAFRFGMKGGMPIATQYDQPPLPAEDRLEEAWKENVAGVDVLMGTTRDELGGMVDVIPGLSSMFRIPFLGARLHGAVVGYATRRVYRNETVRLARLFSDAGASNVWLYEMTFSAPRSGYGSSHSVDLHLMFGSEDVWKNSWFLRGLSWSEVEEAAVRYRGLIADFVRGFGLKDKCKVDGVISYERVAPTS